MSATEILDRYHLDYYYAERFGVSNNRNDPVMVGGLDTAIFGGRPAKNVRIRFNLITECQRGSLFGRHDDGEFAENVLVGVQDAGVSLRSPENAPNGDALVHDNTFIDCGAAVEHGPRSLQRRHFVYRNLFLNFNERVSRAEFFIDVRQAEPSLELHYYHNTMISRLQAPDAELEVGRNFWVWFGGANSKADRIRTFQNNIVIMPGELDQAAVTPLSSGIKSNAVVAPIDDAISQVIEGVGGVFAGTEESDMGLDASYAPDDATLTGVSSPAFDIGVPLPAGFPDSASGAGANTDAGAIFQALNSSDAPIPPPRPAFRLFNTELPSRWTRPGDTLTPPPPVVPPDPPPVGGSSPGLTAIEARANFTVKGSGKPFCIFHEVRFNNTATTPASLGWVEIDTIYQRTWTPDTPAPLSPGNPDIDVPSQSLVNSIVAGADDIFVPDIESWWEPNNDGTNPLSNEAVAAFELTADRINAAKGSKVWGYYSTVPKRSYFGAVNPDKRARWFAANDKNAGIAGKVDIMFPSIYTFSTLRDPADWITYAAFQVSEARRISGDKPVVPYLWPFFHKAGTEQIPTGFMKLQVLTLISLGCEGVVLWETSKNRRLDFADQQIWINGVLQATAEALDNV